MNGKSCFQDLLNSFDDYRDHDWELLGLVEHSVEGRVDVGSNPTSPTMPKIVG
jgi:hypothetical protein